MLAWRVLLVGAEGDAEHALDGGDTQREGERDDQAKDRRAAEVAAQCAAETV